MSTLASSSLCTSNPSIHTSKNHNPWRPKSIPGSKQTNPFDPFLISAKGHRRKSQPRRRFTVVAVTEGSAKNSSKSEESIPTWAKPDSNEPPPWARDEAAAQTDSQQGFEVPFFVYLLASAITAIAAIGSVFEYLNQKPVFGVVNPDSIFYTPLLGFFAFTGIPTSAFLWFKSVETANKEAEEQDRRDGYK